MKKLSKIFALTMGLLMISGTIAMAETKFTPLNFDDSSSVKTTSTTTSSTAVSSADAKGTDLLDPSQVVAGSKMQNSILQIDNAQIELRNKLLNYKNNYAQIDSKYQTTKAERRAAKKQIRYAEKKIRNLDNAKKKIRKNFERKINI